MPKAFAIMAFALAVASPANGAVEPADSSASGETFWLPLPVEEIETPEELDATPIGGAGFSIRAATAEEGMRLRAASAAFEGRSLRAGVSLLGGVDAREALAVSLRAPGAGLDVIAGRVAARSAGSVFAEAVQLSRRTSRVPLARAGIPTLGAATGLASSAIEGVGVRWANRAGSALPDVWALAGRSTGPGTRVGAAGIGARTRWGAWGAAAGALGGAPAGMAAAEWRSARASLASEVTVARRGVATIVSAECGGGPFLARGRWRYRAWDARPVACELSAESGSRWARGRLRVSEGPSGEVGTVGRVELEARVAASGAGPISIRAGRSRNEGFSAAEGATLRGQRYAVLDAALARTEGRRISIVASRRESEIAGAGRVGSSLGARLDLTWRRRAQLEILVEATRVDLAGGSAWDSGLHAGGSTSLRTRTRPGVGASARGAVKAGRWSLGGIVEGREDATGRRSTAATIWIQKTIRAAAPKRGGRTNPTDGGE
jgi:hypothetical protein